MIEPENPQQDRVDDSGQGCDGEPEPGGPGLAAPVWTVYLQVAGSALMYIGGASFAAVACLWGAIKAELIPEFNYLAFAFPTVGAYFAGRIMSYVGRVFSKPEEQDEIVYRRPGRKHE